MLVLWFLAAVGGAIGITDASAPAAMRRSLVGALFLLAMCSSPPISPRIRVYDDPALAARRTCAHHAARRRVHVQAARRRGAARLLPDQHRLLRGVPAALRGRASSCRNVENFYASLPVVLATQLVAFFVVGVYRGVWRYFGLMDAVTIAKGVLLGTVAAQLIDPLRLPLLQLLADGLRHLRGAARGAVTLSRASFRLMGEFVQRQRERRASCRHLRRGRERRPRRARAADASQALGEDSRVHRRRSQDRAAAGGGLPGARRLPGARAARLHRIDRHGDPEPASARRVAPRGARRPLRPPRHRAPAPERRRRRARPDQLRPPPAAASRPATGWADPALPCPIRRHCRRAGGLLWPIG